MANIPWFFGKRDVKTFNSLKRICTECCIYSHIQSLWYMYIYIHIMSIVYPSYVCIYAFIFICISIRWRMGSSIPILGFFASQLGVSHETLGGFPQENRSLKLPGTCLVGNSQRFKTGKTYLSWFYKRHGTYRGFFFGWCQLLAKLVKQNVTLPEV